jgi:hypothetical protein
LELSGLIMSENSYQVLFLNLTSGSGAFNDRRPLGGGEP